MTLNRQGRVKLIEGNHDFSIAEQCEMLSLNRTSLYYKQRPLPGKKLHIMNAIDEIYTEFPVYGSRRVKAALNRQGFQISRAAVAGYMRLMGIEAIYQKPNLSAPHPEHRIYPYLLRNVKAAYPNHIWGTDITYIRMSGSFMYLVAFLDWYSRYVVAWELSDTLQNGFVVRALRTALKTATPAISNSDQGSQFTSGDFINELLANNVKISMDGRGRAMDNIFTERLWRTVKYEDVYIKEYLSPRELRSGMAGFFRKYNEQRLHQSLGYKTPAEVYFSR